jgi:hypothetical protein
MHTGAWNYLSDIPEVKFRTKDAEDIYNTNENFKEAFNKAAKDVIDTEITSKNKIS